MADFLILGGGLTGCVLATRLKEENPSSRVTLLEAGPDEHENPLILDPMGTFQMHNSRYEYNYATVPQKGYDGRQVYNTGGKQLSGSSAVNYATWTRGSVSDYDLWADLVGDARWGYEGMLPYFRRTETHYDPERGDPEQHGFDGPILTTAGARIYPLMDVMQSAFIKGTGLPAIADGNGGNPIGVAPLTENWHPKGYRQPAGRAYGLKGVEVVTNAQVHRIILDGNVATGAELVDGRRFTAEREVIVCCGAIRTPQVLLLSGIGPAEELARHGIKQLVDSPDVGLNFHDQIAMCQFFKIKNPDNLGLVAGSPLWNDPSYLLGVPADIVIVDTAPLKELKAAMIADGEPNVTDSHPHLQTNRGHLELLPIYAPTEAPLTNLNIPFDGTCITVGQLNLLPTSRGSVTLASPDPSADPVIDPNYFATEADKVVVRHAMRHTMRSFETPEGQTIIEGEITPEGAAALTSKSSDAELDARIRKTASTWFHPGGSAAMGKVVDADLRVIGVERLRVCDVSVLPCPIGAHYQVASYALAEQAADIISKN